MFLPGFSLRVFNHNPMKIGHKKKSLTDANEFSFLFWKSKSIKCKLIILGFLSNTTVFLDFKSC